jgi:FAD/FMN-containing dehydrogenase/Fe-S oxidoreductase
LQLDVLQQSPDEMGSAALSAELAREICGEIRGEVRFSRIDRLLYSTDASVYQEEPIGVVVPADEADAVGAVKAISRRGVAILPRGGGTSLAGQCTNRAVVLDLSANLRGLESLDVEKRTIRAQAGATLDAINRHLTKTGTQLVFAPDPASAAQATIGGCIGNNAAGTRSIRYGRTSENIAGVEVILADGARLTLEAGAGRKDAAALGLAKRVGEIVRRNAELISARFPKTLRRNAGYGLDLILKQTAAGVADEDLDLSGLICGSEGTLAIVLAATLKLHPVPKARGLAVVPFATVADAIAAVPAINGTGASAVELLDDVVLGAAGGNSECRRYLEWIPGGVANLPRAVLYVEYQVVSSGEASSGDELAAAFDRLAQSLPSNYTFARCTDAAALADLWALRKAAEPLLHSIGGGVGARRKPQTFVEDNAVPVERLGEFVEGFRRIVESQGTSAAYYAHASVGVLHVRPLIDIHSPEDRERMEEIAVAVADLTKQCGGVMSGEHGDGRARGPLLERYFGAEIMEIFRQIKAVFDPKNLLNPRNITQPGPIGSIVENLRIDRERVSKELDSVDTYFDYADQHGFGSAIEMCNGAGVCRKTAGGTMCPSYRALLDERHSTRGRGNALRLAITGQLSKSDGPAWDDAGTIETLHLCLSCKACKSECPSNVDIARLKAEYTGQRYRRNGVPTNARLMGNVRRLNEMGSIFPGVANWMAASGLFRPFIDRLMGFAPERSLPKFGKPLAKWFRRRRNPSAPGAPRVVLFDDCFTGYNETRIGKMAVRVMERLGYAVAVPNAGCCGRAMISTGLLQSAITTVDRTLERLKPFIEDPEVRAILFLEPSCLSAAKDDWLQLKLRTPIGLRRQLAEKSMLVDEFFDSAWEEHPKKAMVQRIESPVILHGHCHQKALWGDAGSAAALRRVAANVEVLPSGCCGMAGSFGFSADRYALSMRIGELSVFPAVRAARENSLIAAPGTSCRHQIRDGTLREAEHPVGIIARALGVSVL